MEILKRARGASDGDIVPWNADKKTIQDEVNARSAKAGYTTRLGEPPYSTKIQTVCGWGKERLNVWPRDKDGHLIGE